MTANYWRWELDPFFAAAEDVQESADRLESAYRTWIHAAGVLTTGPSDQETYATIDFQRRHLTTTLGTAKWQVEEFERAVTPAASAGHADDDAHARHRQFVQALNYKISMIEKDIMDAASQFKIRPTCPLKLENHDRDIFAKFLIGTNSLKSLVTTDIQLMNPFVRVECKDESADVSCKDETVSSLSRDSWHRVPSMHTSPALSPARAENETRNTGACALRKNRAFEASDIDTWVLNVPCKRIDTSVDILFERGEPPSTEHVPDTIVEEERTEHTFKQTNGQQRSVSISSGLNHWKVQALPKNIEDTKPQRCKSASSNLTLWPLFSKKRRPIDDGFKKWKDGSIDLKGSQRCLNPDGVVIDTELGKCDSWLRENELSDGYGLGHILVGEERSSRWGLRRSQHPFSSSRFTQLTSLILLALGFVGLLSFHSTASI